MTGRRSAAALRVSGGRPARRAAASDCRWPPRAGRCRGRPARDRARGGPAGHRRDRAQTPGSPGPVRSRRARCASARHDQTEAERLDEAPALLAGPGRELEIDLGNVDHHPIGIGKREGAQVDLWLRSITRRVCLSSPARRASVATGIASPGPGSGIGPARFRPKHRQAGHSSGSHPRRNAQPAVHHPKSPAHCSWSLVLLLARMLMVKCLEGLDRILSRVRCGSATVSSVSCGPAMRARAAENGNLSNEITRKLCALSHGAPGSCGLPCRRSHLDRESLKVQSFRFCRVRASDPSSGASHRPIRSGSGDWPVAAPLEG